MCVSVSRHMNKRIDASINTHKICQVHTHTHTHSPVIVFPSQMLPIEVQQNILALQNGRGRVSGGSRVSCVCVLACVYECVCVLACVCVCVCVS
jgi:hypothetical protein